MRVTVVNNSIKRISALDFYLEMKGNETYIEIKHDKIEREGPIVTITRYTEVHRIPAEKLEPFLKLVEEILPNYRPNVQGSKKIYFITRVEDQKKISKALREIIAKL